MVLIHLPRHKQTVIFIEIDRRSLAEVVAAEVHTDHNTKSISDEPHLQGNVQSLVEEDKLVEGSSVVEKKMEEEVHIEEEEKVADNTTSINLHSKV